MKEWLENGVKLGWLIDPIDQQAWVYAKANKLQDIDSFRSKLVANEVVDGFELDLASLI